MLLQQLPVVFSGGLERLSFPAEAFVGEKGVVNLAIPGQPDKEAVGALFVLVDPRDSCVTFGFASGHTLDRL
jgi:hypothetical protein